MSDDPSNSQRQTRDVFEAYATELRPKLHRYCARMVGSALDADDIVQESFASAFANWPEDGVERPEGWLFRITHNRAMDYLRRRKRSEWRSLSEAPDAGYHELLPERREVATFALSIFLQLTPLQRSCVILKDVLGYSIAEVAGMMDLTTAGVKAALHRARGNLRKLAQSVGDEVPLQVDHGDEIRLKDYVQRFVDRDFNGIRAQLLDDVRLDLVQRLQAEGVDRVSRYFTNYESVELSSVVPVLFDGWPAVRITDEAGDYVVVLTWREDRIASIRDFRYARYVMEGGIISTLG